MINYIFVFIYNLILFILLYFLSMVYQTAYPWYFEPSYPWPWYIDPLPMEYRLPYPWYFDPPTHGILTPLPMAFWPPYSWYFDPSYPWYFEPPTHGILTPPAYLLIRNEEVQNTMEGQYTMDENWPQGQNTMGVKIPYDSGLWENGLERRLQYCNLVSEEIYQLPMYKNINLFTWCLLSRVPITS